MALQRADQDLQRKYKRFKDIHGRQWGAVTEIKTGDPCGLLEPHFSAPWLPPQQFMRYDGEDHVLRINYDALIAERTRARKAYFEKGKRYGFEKYGALFDPSKPFTEEILLHLGPEPLPYEPAIAAKQGNRWILGLKGPNGETPKMPEKLAKWFTKPVVKEEVFEDTFEDELEAPKRGPGRPKRITIPEDEEE